MKKFISIILAIAIIIAGNYSTNIVKADDNTENIEINKNAEFTVALNEKKQWVITGYEGNAENLTIPSAYEGRKIVGIDVAAISNDYLKTLTLSEGIEYINVNGITECPNLEEVNIPSTVTEKGFGMGAYPIYDCYKLKKVNVSNKNKELVSEDGVVYAKDMKSILKYPEAKEDKTFKIKDGIENVFVGCFQNNENIEEIYIPNSVKNIDDYAFSYCKKLSKADIPSQCKYIGDIAFADSIITYVNIPKTVNAMGDGVFGRMNYLDKITVEKGNPCFSVSDGVLYFNYKDGSRDIVAIKSTYDKEEYVVPDNVKYIGSYVLQENPYIKKVYIPESVNSIGYAAFFGCDNLTEVHIPYSVKYAEGLNFDGSSDYVVSMYLYENSYSEKRFVKDDENILATFVFNYVGRYEKITLEKNTSQNLKTTNKTNDCSIEELALKSNNPKVAEVKNGKVIAKSIGTALIKAKYGDYEFVYEINVIDDKHITKLNFAKKNVEIKKGKTKKLKTVVDKKDNVDKYTYSSSNKKIATVDKDGKVTAKKAGKVTITVKSSNGLKATCTVNVKAPVTKMKFSTKLVKLKRGLTRKVKLTINPGDYTDKIKCEAFNKGIKIVSKKKVKNGMVITFKTKRKGYSGILMTASSGKVARYYIRVR